MNKCEICGFNYSNALNQVFMVKADELSIVTNEDNEYLAKNNINTAKAHNRVLNAIYNVPNGFRETIRELKESVEDLVDQSSFEQGYLCEKYFKERN